MTKLLNISEAASLALHTMVSLGRTKDRLYTTKDIADALKASSHHLAKVMRRLVENDLIESVSGPKGGFRIIKDLEDISLLQIYEIFDGKINAELCLFKNKICGDKSCFLGEGTMALTKKIYDFFRDTTLKSLCSPKKDFDYLS